VGSEQAGMVSLTYESTSYRFMVNIACFNIDNYTLNNRLKNRKHINDKILTRNRRDDNIFQ
jgi:hypothetical protein